MMKMAKHTLKILRCSHSKIFKACLAIFDHCDAIVKRIFQIATCWKNYKTVEPIFCNQPHVSHIFSDTNLIRDSNNQKLCMDS